MLISAAVAAILNVSPGDKITAHFVQDPPRARVFTVKGIYDTGFKEYDEMLAVCDIRHLQKLNNWAPREVSGIAVELNDMKRILEVEAELDDTLPMNQDDDFIKSLLCGKRLLRSSIG